MLASSFREMIQGDSFDLTAVWDLLAGQPRFDAAEVMPAFAKVKSWETKLGKTIGLPPPMQDLGEVELGEMAATIHVPASDLAHVLRGGKVQTDRIDPVPAEPVPAEPRAASKPPRIRLSQPQRRAATVAAGVVAALAFAFAGVTLARGCQTRTWSEVAVDFAGDIPLAGAERSGPEVAATLRDPDWLQVPAGRRQEQMSAALRALPSGVEVFFVRDRAGKVIAAARWYGKRPRRIAVTLR